MVAPKFDIFVLDCDAPCDVELPPSNVEVCAGYGYSEVNFYAFAGDGARVRGFLDAAEGTGADEIGGLD